MILDLKNLPSGDSVTHPIIIDLVEKMLSLESQLNLLRAKLYGASSEKIKKQIDDLTQQIEEDEASLASALPMLSQSYTDADIDTDAEIEATASAKPKRKKLPSHLERTDIVLNPDPKCPNCGGEDFRNISSDESETLEYIPSSFKVMRYIRPRCACINCETIVQAYPQSGGIDKGKAGPGLLAHILVQKYCNHLPFYRQSQIYEREEIELSRSTMASWAGQCAKLLRPLIDECKSVFLSDHIQRQLHPVLFGDFCVIFLLRSSNTAKYWSGAHFKNS